MSEGKDDEAYPPGWSPREASAAAAELEAGSDGGDNGGGGDGGGDGGGGAAAAAPPQRSLAALLAREEKSSDVRPLLVEVADFFNKQRFDPDGTGGGLELIFSDFIDSHCAAFEGEAPLPVAQDEQVDLGDGSGMSLEFSALHEQYLQKFEDSCSWAIEVNQGSAKKFYDECEQAMQGNLPEEFAGHGDVDNVYQWFIDAMMAAMDYAKFYRVMVGAAHAQKMKRVRALQKKK